MSKEVKKDKKATVAVFDVTKVDSLKRKRIVSLCKQAGIKANKNNDELKEALKAYHKDHKAQIDQESKERKRKKPKKGDLLKGLDSTVHYDVAKTTID